METLKSLQYSDIILILSGIIMGTVARVITLHVDNRQNPSFPGGVFINLVTGFIASILGAVAIPAIMIEDFTAVTFLALAIQQFRDIRKLESESLTTLEDTEYAKRGESYIDGIAKTYESRNYISLLTSFFTVFVMKIFYMDKLYIDCIIGLLTGLAVTYTLKLLTKGKTVGDICTITEGNITVEQSELYVDGMFVTNFLGTDMSRELFLNEGIAVVLTPDKTNFQVTLNKLGQQQAILFEAIRSFGLKKYQFTHNNIKTGQIIIAFVPMIHNVTGVINAVKKTPVLESSRKIGNK